MKNLMWRLNNTVFWAPEGAGAGSEAAAAPTSETPAPSGDKGPTEDTNAPKVPADTPVDDQGFADIAELLDLRESEKTNKVEDDTAPKPPIRPEGEEQVKDGKPVTPVTPPVAAPTTTEGGEKGELKSALKELLEEVKGEKKPPETKTEAPPPKYLNVQVPDQIIQAMDSQDPATRKMGLNAMIGAAMSKVYSDVVTEVSAKIQERFSQVPQIIEQNDQQKLRTKELAEDFYGAYPQFRTPKGVQLAAMVSVQLAKEEGKEFKGWTPEFRDKLGNALVELTGLQKPPAKVEDNKSGKPAGTPKGQFNSNTGARPATAGAKSLADEITETIN